MFKKNQKVKCLITAINEHGIFVKLDNDYTGLIRKNTLKRNKKHKINDIVEAKVTNVKKDKKQVDLVLIENNKYPPLKEMGKGFLPLKKQLPKWINEKLGKS